MPRDNARAGARARVRRVRRAGLRPRRRPTSSCRSTPTSCASERPRNLRYARAVRLAPPRRRRPRDNLNRLYVVESDATGHRRPRRSSAAAQGEPGRGVRARRGRAARRRRRHRRGARRHARRCVDAARRRICRRIAAAALVMAGEAQPAAVHALAHAMNDALGNVGATVTYTPTPEARADRTARRRCASWSATWTPAACRCCVIIGESNPVFTRAGRLQVRRGDEQGGAARALGPVLRRDRRRCASGTCPRRTTSRRGATRARVDGTVSIVQPLIQPLYGGKSAHEVMATLSRSRRSAPATTSSRVLDGARRRAAARQPRPRRARGRTGAAAARGRAAPAPRRAASAPRPPRPFEKQWRKWLHDGFIAGTRVRAEDGDARRRLARRSSPPAPPVDGVEVNFRRDPTDLRRPLRQQRLAAGTAQADDQADVGQRRARSRRRTAERLGVAATATCVERQAGRPHAATCRCGSTPGHAQDAMTITSATAARAPAASATAPASTPTRCAASARRGSAPPTIAKTGDTYELVGTQDHWSIEGRNLVRSAHARGVQGRTRRSLKEMEHVQARRAASRSTPTRSTRATRGAWRST